MGSSSRKGAQNHHAFQPPQPHRKQGPRPPDIRPVYKTFTPVGDLVAVKVHWTGETAGGIALPDGSGDPEGVLATVVAVGPGVKDPNIKEGCTVCTGLLAMGVELAVGGSGRVLCLKEDSICGVMLPAAVSPTSRTAEAAVGEGR
jgi:co-chaperonin GroES (HSP10)